MKKILLVLGLVLIVAFVFGCGGETAPPVQDEVATVETPPPPPPPPPPVEQPPEPEVVESDFSTVYFDFDKSNIRPDQVSILSQNARILQENPDIKIRVEGNCDERGTVEYNLALGDRRAKSVKDYLVNLGIQENRISTISYGEERPAVQGNNEQAWAKNRRAEFRMVE